MICGSLVIYTCIRPVTITFFPPCFFMVTHSNADMSGGFSIDLLELDRPYLFLIIRTASKLGMLEYGSTLNGETMMGRTLQACISDAQGGLKVLALHSLVLIITFVSTCCSSATFCSLLVVHLQECSSL